MITGNGFRVAALIVIMGGTLGISKITDRRATDALVAPLESIPMTLAGWTASEDTPILPRVADKLHATALVNRVYRKGGLEMPVFVAYYAQQRAGESMHSPKNCLPGTGWVFLEQHTTALSAGGKSVDVNLARIQNGANKMLILYWYQSRRRIVASEYVGKLLTMRDAVVDGRTGGSLVRVMLPDVPGAASEMSQFAPAMVSEIQRCLGH